MDFYLISCSVNWEKIFELIKTMLPLGGLITGIKLLFDYSDSKKKSDEQRNKKLIIEAKFFDFVAWISDENRPIPRPTNIRIKLINPKNYEIQIHTIKLLSEDYLELEVKNQVRNITIFSGPENEKIINERFSSLKSVQNQKYVKVRLIDNEGQFHDSAPIYLTAC